MAATAMINSGATNGRGEQAAAEGKIARRRLAAVPGRGSIAPARAKLRAGRLSPTRTVPAEIPRPPYAPDAPALMPAVPPDEFVDRMRAAGHAAREVLLEVGAAVRVGVTTDELDRVCHEACIARGGYPSPLHYKGFPKSLCTSVNEIICHGIPDDRVLVDGDIVNCDVTIFLNGVHGDTQRDVPRRRRRRSRPRPRARHRRKSMWKGIDAVQPGAASTTSAARSRRTRRPPASVSCARSSGTASVRRSTPRRRCRTTSTRAPITSLVAGMTFTIEPMITEGSWELGPDLVRRLDRADPRPLPRPRSSSTRCSSPPPAPRSSPADRTAAWVRSRRASLH